MTNDTLLRDLVEIPTSVQGSDFVVKLRGGIGDPEKLLGDYVVTEDIARSFDQALSLITSALQDGQSKGAYLHGSFGSGKSHFMAVLHLLLQGNPDARAKDKLAPVIADYDDALDDADILLVPYHMVGKESMEAGILGGYVDHVRANHPEASLPAVFASDTIFADAKRQRERMGDEDFFAELGGAAEDVEGLGNLVGGWNPDLFDRAVNAAPDDEERRRLTADLIATFFQGYAELAEGADRGAGYVPLADGLSAISQHAKQLGYDAMLLFLDELILWLGSRIADREFIAREVPKLSLLVEGAGPRPAPIVSLIARQRDLKDFVGEGVAGVDRAGLDHGLDYQSGRFGTITLADANLPAIVEQRLLRPVSDSAETTLDDAFERFTQRADRSLDTLMTDEADRRAFRRTYPFSPALIQVLVGVSAFLQRQRTGLKLLSELLVDRRDELTIGQIVPLGDLWDVVDRGDKPMDGTLATHFAKARRLYDNKLRPLILEEYDLAEEDVADLPATHGFHADDRLAKTLLLAALVPETPAVRGMTAGRLADLNHGSIRTPVPGGERARVIGTLRKWAGRVPELRVDGEEQDPSVSLHLVGVDTDAILEKVANQDRPGARQVLVRDLLGEAIDVDVSGTMTPTVRHVWRGRKREVELLFGNIRDPAEIPDAAFDSSPQQPKLLIDHPFDVGDFRPVDDAARVEQLRERWEQDGRQLPPTACWIPRTLTARARDDLGRLLLIEYLLTGDRLDKNTRDLPEKQRIEARQQLAAQREQLRSQLREVLRQAYGIVEADPTVVDDGIDYVDMFVCLDPTIQLRPPKQPSFVDAFHELLDQLWSGIAPAHPEFELKEVRRRDLARTLELVQEAASHPERRIDIAPEDRSLLQGVIAPLQLGPVGEAHFQLGKHWYEHFDKQWARDGRPAQTVERLQQWTDRPQRRLLDPEVLALVISAYAVEADLAIEVGGASMEPQVQPLPARAELVEVDLPDASAWEQATDIAQEVFGVQTARVLSAGNVASMATRVREVAAGHRDAASRLVDAVQQLADRFDVPADADRRRTAATVKQLCDDVASTDDGLGLVRVLAETDPPTSAVALGTSMKQSETVARAISDANLGLLEIAFDLDEPYAGQAATIRQRLVNDIRHDQHAVRLERTLRAVADDATVLLRKAQDAGEKREAGTGDGGERAPEDGGSSTVSRSETHAIEDARARLGELAESGVERVTIQWEDADS